MREMNLTFRNPDEVLDFVKTVEQYPFDMDLCRGSVVVDAKSLLGIMNLGFNQTVNLKIYSNDCNELFHNSENLPPPREFPPIATARIASSSMFSPMLFASAE